MPRTGSALCVRCCADTSPVEALASARLAALAETSPSMYPEQVAAEASRVSAPQAPRGFERAVTTTAIPQLGAALEAGETSGAHVDVVTRALRGLNPQQTARLVERGDILALAAAQQPRDEFVRTVRGEVRRNDGIERLQRQRRATSLRTWLDRETGMWCLRGELDPETGALLDGRLRNTIEAMFHDRQPGTCPTDPVMKQHHLRAPALMALTQGAAATGSGSAAPRIDISVLIDAQTPIDGTHSNSVTDVGLGFDLPVETLRRWACLAEITPVIVGNDGVSLFLGRDSRHANRAQRRALRAMYGGCGISGCSVTFDHCQIHHLRWFRNNGLTDIDNLLPLCSKHHHLVHEGGWRLSLDNRRNLTVTVPDGSIMTTGPPSAWAR